MGQRLKLGDQLITHATNQGRNDGRSLASYKKFGDILCFCIFLCSSNIYSLINACESLLGSYAFREHYLIISGAVFVLTSIINVQRGLGLILLAIVLLVLLVL